MGFRKHVLVVVVFAILIGTLSSYLTMIGLAEKCALCGISIHSAYEVEIHFKGGSLKKYCCIHCATKAYYNEKDTIEFVFATDEVSGEKWNAFNCWYVESDLISCAPCGTKIHVFLGALDGLERATKHIEDFSGELVENPFRLV